MVTFFTSSALAKCKPEFKNGQGGDSTGGVPLVFGPITLQPTEFMPTGLIGSTTASVAQAEAFPKGGISCFIPVISPMKEKHMRILPPTETVTWAVLTATGRASTRPIFLLSASRLPAIKTVRCSRDIGSSLPYQGTKKGTSSIFMPATSAA